MEPVPVPPPILASHTVTVASPRSSVAAEEEDTSSIHPVAPEEEHSPSMQEASLRWMPGSKPSVAPELQAVRADPAEPSVFQLTTFFSRPEPISTPPEETVEEEEVAYF